jgi:hypothetical protein
MVPDYGPGLTLWTSTTAPSSTRDPESAGRSVMFDAVSFVWVESNVDLRAWTGGASGPRVPFQVANFVDRFGLG